VIALGGRGLLLLLALCGGPLAAAQADGGFEHLAIRLERNMTDHDVEIVFEVTGGERGLKSLKAVAPDGRTVFDLQSPQTALGLRSFRIESPEPKALEALLKDYPAGEYRFSAVSVSGEALSGSALLAPALPTAATVISPQPGASQVDPRSVQIRWGAGGGRASCIVSIEDEASGRTVLQATLPGSATSLAVPERTLGAGTRYKLAIGTVAEGGNASYVESTFATARRP